MGNASIEERREIAGRLRAGSGHGLLGLYSAVLGDDAKNRTAVLYKRLADLIDPGEDTTVSAYGLLSDEDRETLLWVKESGGIDAVQKEVSNYTALCRSIQDADNRRAELCSALGIDPDTGWSDAMAEMLRRLMPPGFEWTDAFEDAVDFMDCIHDLLYTIDGDEHTSNEMLVEMVKRLMPEGCEWPRYVSGEPVKFGDGVNRIGGDFEVSTIRLYYDSSFSLNSRPYLKGERVKRSAVLAADGKLIKKCDTVWPVEGGDSLYVDRVDVESQTVTTRPFGLSTCADEREFKPSQLTHTKPAYSDSWETIEEESKLYRCEYFDHMDGYCHDCPGGPSGSCRANMMIDIVRRCKALAGKGETE